MASPKPTVIQFWTMVLSRVNRPCKHISDADLRSNFEPVITPITISISSNERFDTIKLLIELYQAQECMFHVYFSSYNE